MAAAPPRILPPKIKKEVQKEVQKEEKDVVKQAAQAHKADPEASLKGLEQSLGLTPTREFLTGAKPAERAKEAVSGDGDDDDDEEDDEEPI